MLIFKEQLPESLVYSEKKARLLIWFWKANHLNGTNSFILDVTCFEINCLSFSDMLLLFLSYFRVFKRAARINAHRLILVGNSEWQRGMVVVKILSSGEQYEVKLDELV